MAGSAVCVQAQAAARGARVERAAERRGARGGGAEGSAPCTSARPWLALYLSFQSTCGARAGPHGCQRRAEWNAAFN